MSTPITITINGENTTLPAGAHLSDAITHTCGRANPYGVAAAIGHDVIPRSAWDTTPLQAGDSIEILTAVQGG